MCERCGADYNSIHSFDHDGRHYIRYFCDGCWNVYCLDYVKATLARMGMDMHIVEGDK
jgi:hypothetical protein